MGFLHDDIEEQLAGMGSEEEEDSMATTTPLRSVEKTWLQRVVNNH